MLDDVKYTEELTKDNDYTISVVRKGENSHDGVRFNSRITRSFNFLAAQVTTTTRDITYQGGGYQSGGSSGVSTTTTMQRFDEFQSDAEIRLMHLRLVALGGNPPALDDILPAPAKPALAAPSVKGLNP